jgi:hypothetical protein
MDSTAGAPPSVFLHAVEVYRRMQSEATTERLPEGGEGLVWSGHLTKLITGPPLNLPIPYYTVITQAFKGMDCARQLKRGGGTAPSRWALIKPPSQMEYEKWESSRATPRRTSKTSMLEQRVVDLSDRVDAMEDAFQTLLEALQDKE